MSFKSFIVELCCNITSDIASSAVCRLVELISVTDNMARDLLRDFIFIAFVACFFYSVHDAALKLMARTKSVKSR